jgi:hypothetical protein
MLLCRLQRCYGLESIAAMEMTKVYRSLPERSPGPSWLILIEGIIRFVYAFKSNGVGRDWEVPCRYSPAFGGTYWCSAC